MNSNYNVNESAWDKKVDDGAVWTLTISSKEIEQAKKGDIRLNLGGNINIPLDWLPKDIKGKKVLCLASGGGQQAPIFSAIGCETTVLDISEKQLEQDILVAKRDNLIINTVKGDMCDLSMFANDSFDIVFCPVSVTYIADTLPVFKECYRILKQGGSFMLGTVNPHIYAFDGAIYDEGVYTVSNKLPFNSLDELSEQERKEFLQNKNAIEYSHTMQTLIGNQTDCGFAIVGFFESNDDKDGIGDYFAKFYNTKAIKI